MRNSQKKRLAQCHSTVNIGFAFIHFFGYPQGTVETYPPWIQKRMLVYKISRSVVFSKPLLILSISAPNGHAIHTFSVCSGKHAQLYELKDLIWGCDIHYAEPNQILVWSMSVHHCECHDGKMAGRQYNKANPWHCDISSMCSNSMLIPKFVNLSDIACLHIKRTPWRPIWDTTAPTHTEKATLHNPTACWHQYCYISFTSGKWGDLDILINKPSICSPFTISERQRNRRQWIMDNGTMDNEAPCPAITLIAIPWLTTCRTLQNKLCCGLF